MAVVRLDKAERARITALEYKGEVLPTAPPGPWMSATLCGRYSSGSWVGWCDGWSDDWQQRWILFVDSAGHCLLWTARDEDGGVLGKPYAVERPDLIEPPKVGSEAPPDYTPRADGRVLRIDTGGALRSPVQMDNGWLRVDAHITRSGIFRYTNADGTARYEYRPESEVMDAASLASFAMVPVTNEHPSGLLDASNAKQHAVGSVGENVRRDGTHVAAPLLITDARTISDVQAGKSEVSCGYACDYDPTPGTFQGQHFDGTQRKIRGNHVAIVDSGRAGSAKLRLDAGDAVMDHPGRHDGGTTMKVTINGVEVDLPDATVQLITAERHAHKTTLDAANVALERMTADRDGQKSRADTAESQRNDAADPAKFSARVNARVNLVAQARSVLGATFKLDALDDKGIQLAVLGKLGLTEVGGVKLDTKSDVYIAARFDGEMERLDKANPALARARAAAENVDPSGQPREDADEDLDQKHRDQMVKEGQDAWKPKK